MLERSFILVAGLFLVTAVETSATETLLIPVPLRTIYVGESVNNADLTMKMFSVSETSRKTYAIDVDQFSRMEAARVLIAGKPVSLRSLRNIEDVKKGQQVKAIYFNGVIEIQAMLLPLSNGSIGDVIEAKNVGSGNTVKAQIASDGSLIVIGK